ncbi:uncharacterized protein LOC143414373 [Maylandia zebra]|uniref:uncharacterized protein LOC143414373 n=1 Tax=Maylandia zebra TaxID=106582 RepID=UPI00403C59F9
MARSCCIINCTSRASNSRVKPTGKAIGFYRIPAWSRNIPSHVSEVKKRRRMAWIAAIRRPNITFENTPPHMLVCSKHFHKAPVTTETTAEIQPQQITPQHEDEDLQDCKMCSLRLQEIAHLQEENLILQKELSKRKLDMEFLKDNNSKVKFYTGLPSFALLMGVLQQISPSLPDTDRKISQFQMLLLTLMRLRLNLPIVHIAHLFDISRTTTSTVFNITVNVLYAHLSPLVHWPGRHCIQASMPHQYVEMFGDRVTVIIDCFELFIERAQNLCAMVETYSTYKSRHTMKYLIGITPQGTISFISKGWGGRTSDKRIAETSGFLQKLSPGDTVLADRGFDIKESVALMGATLKIPAFTRGRSQLQAKDVEDTRKLAHVRIHVERVIGCLRSKYTILNDTIRLGFVVPCEGENMTLLDKIVAVSCALTNMCPSVVVKHASDE